MCGLFIAYSDARLVLIFKLMRSARVRFDRDAPCLGCLAVRIELLHWGSFKHPELSHLPVYILLQVCFNHLAIVFYNYCVCVCVRHCPSF